MEILILSVSFFDMGLGMFVLVLDTASYTVVVFWLYEGLQDVI